MLAKMNPSESYPREVGGVRSNGATVPRTWRTQQIDPSCADLFAEMKEEAAALDVSPPPLDDPTPQQYAWMEATAALLADVYGRRLDRMVRFREQLINMKHLSHSRGVAPENKREYRAMARGFFEVLALMEHAVSIADRWRNDVWDRTKVLLPEIAKDLQVVCANNGHLDSSQLSEAIAEWRRIEVATAGKRALAGEPRWDLSTGTWTSAERAAWRLPEWTASRTHEHEEMTMSQSDRRSLSPDDEAKVLEKCRRRCCVCFVLDNDALKKKGQLAHLDHDRSNNAIDNFVYLCLFHHDTYDSKTSQTKNLTEREVRLYQKRLHEAVAQGEVPPKQGPATLKFPVQQSGPVSINGNNNVVATGNVNYTLNMSRPKRGRGRSAVRPPILPGTVSEDPRMVGYLNYLVRRYEKFKKWECDRNGQRMGYGVIRNAYKRELKYELIHTPKAHFDVGARYLQRRIVNTRLGRMKRGQRLYSLFSEFDEHTGNDEGLPV